MNGNGYRHYSPWDRLPAFAIPVETTFVLGSTPTRIAIGDDMRTLLAISLTGPGVGGGAGVPIAFGSVTGPLACISTNPAVTLATGFAITPLNPLITIDYRIWGAAVAREWWAIGQGDGSVSVTVLAVTMKGWPETEQVDNLIVQTNNGYFR